MNKKFFIRGLGVGMVFGALIMLVAYLTTGKGSLTDEEIMERAQKLGMVKESEYVLSTDASTTQQTTTEATTSEPTTEATTENTTTEATTTETATTEATTEITTTEAATTEAKKEDKKDKKTITVTSGMSSETIAQLLADAGFVKNASEFNSFLVSNGYDMKLEVGTFELNASMTYEEIAKILTQKQ